MSKSTFFYSFFRCGTRQLSAIKVAGMMVKK